MEFSDTSDATIAHLWCRPRVTHRWPLVWTTRHSPVPLVWTRCQWVRPYITPYTTPYTTLHDCRAFSPPQLRLPPPILRCESRQVAASSYIWQSSTCWSFWLSALRGCVILHCPVCRTLSTEWRETQCVAGHRQSRCYAIALEWMQIFSTTSNFRIQRTIILLH